VITAVQHLSVRPTMVRFIDYKQTGATRTQTGCVGDLRVLQIVIEPSSSEEDSIPTPTQCTHTRGLAGEAAFSQRKPGRPIQFLTQRRRPIVASRVGCILSTKVAAGDSFKQQGH
jgi:hypothetical protein